MFDDVPQPNLLESGPARPIYTHVVVCMRVCERGNVGTQWVQMR